MIEEEQTRARREERYNKFSNDEFNMLCFAIATWREEKGFFTPSLFTDTVHINEKLMLVVTEVAEACEAVRHQNYENFKEEIADTFIRLMDLCGTMGFDIEKEIIEKMKINENRPQKHGKTC